MYSVPGLNQPVWSISFHSTVMDVLTDLQFVIAQSVTDLESLSSTLQLFCATAHEPNRDIEIVLHNLTKDSRIVILIFGQNHPIPLTKETVNMAWKIMLVPSQKSAKIKYPMQDKIGVAYSHAHDGNEESQVTNAQPGTTWVASATSHGSISLVRDGKPASIQNFMLRHTIYAQLAHPLS